MGYDNIKAVKAEKQNLIKLLDAYQIEGDEYGIKDAREELLTIEALLEVLHK